LLSQYQLRSSLAQTASKSQQPNTPNVEIAQHSVQGALQRLYTCKFSCCAAGHQIHPSGGVNSTTESSCLANARACNCASKGAESYALPLVDLHPTCQITRLVASADNVWKRGLMGDSLHPPPKVLHEFIFNLLLFIMSLLLTRTAYAHAIHSRQV